MIQPLIDLYNVGLKGKYEVTGEEALKLAQLFKEAENSIREIAKESKDNGPTEESE